MAHRAGKPCTYPGCGAVAAGGAGSRCPAHAYDKARGKTAERGYDGAWRKVAAAKLAADPFCQIRLKCDGGIAEAVDHRIPRWVRPDLRLSWDNLQSCCTACNTAKREVDRKTNWALVPEANKPHETISF